MNKNPPSLPQLSFSSILRGLCPSCHSGKVTRGFFGTYPQCAKCRYDFHPESGFYLGAMVVSFFVTAALTIPPMILLKILDVELEILLAFPFLEFLLLGPVLLVYSKILWLHLEYRLTHQLNKPDR